jgi:hypothetical protein
MSDDDDQTELPATETPTIAPPDIFAAALALIAIALDPNSTGARLRSLQEHQAAAAKATAAFATAQEAFDQHCATERAAVAAEREQLAKESAAAQGRHDRVLAVLHDIEVREKAIYRLEQIWKFVGEDTDVRSGFREPVHGSALEKARKAFGLDDGEPQHDVELPRNDEDFARSLPPNVTLTRTQESPPRTAAARRAQRRAMEA